MSETHDLPTEAWTRAALTGGLLAVILGLAMGGAAIALSAATLDARAADVVACEADCDDVLAAWSRVAEGPAGRAALALGLATAPETP